MANGQGEGSEDRVIRDTDGGHKLAVAGRVQGDAGLQVSRAAVITRVGEIIRQGYDDDVTIAELVGRIKEEFDRSSALGVRAEDFGKVLGDRGDEHEVGKSPGVVERFEALSVERKNLEALEGELRRDMQDYLLLLLGESDINSWDLSTAKLSLDRGKIVVSGINMDQFDPQGVRINNLLEQKGFRVVVGARGIDDDVKCRLTCSFDLGMVERTLSLRADLDALEKDPVDEEEA